MPRLKEPLPLEKYDIYADKPKPKRRKVTARKANKPKRRRRRKTKDTTVELLLDVKRLNTKYSLPAIRAALATYQTLVGDKTPQQFTVLG